jgi:predicted RNase H-like HicB family nuclease
MQERCFTVKAAWDSESEVWYVIESDVPGLVAEAETPQALMKKLRVLVPELVELNRHLLDWVPKGELPIHLMAEQLEHVPLNS